MWGKWDNNRLEEKLLALRGENVQLISRLQEIENRISQISLALTSSDGSKLLGRLEELELWRARVHNLLTEVSPLSGREKISKMGKRLSTFYKR